MSDLPQVTQRPGWPLPTRCAAFRSSSCFLSRVLQRLPLWPPPLDGLPGGRAQGLGGCLAPLAAPAQVPRASASLQYMEKLSQLAYHPLKMQSCYEKMEPLRLDGLQQRFDVSSTSVFKQRAQILMREVSPGCYPSCPRCPQVPISSSPGEEAASVAFLPSPLLVVPTGLAAATLGPRVLSAALLSGLFGPCPSAPPG